MVMRYGSEAIGAGGYLGLPAYDYGQILNRRFRSDVSHVQR